MTITNFKTQTAIKMEIELEAWKACEKDWTVSNQFDETVLESALQNMDKMSDEDWTWWMNTNGDKVMGIAHALSQFDAPELDSAWVN